MRSFAITLGLLSLHTFAQTTNEECDFSFQKKDCKKITSYSECMNSVNDDLLDATKCIPIVEGSDEDPCVSWDHVEEGGYDVDYVQNHATLTQEQLEQIDDLRKVAYWGQYPYYVQEKEAELQDQSVIQDESKGTLAVVGYEPSSNQIVLSFRGSSNIQNWLSNFDFVKTAYTSYGCLNCQVHEGFYHSYLTLQEGVLSSFYSVLGSHPGAKITVTGHSLGSAQSVFAALDLVSQGHRVNFYSYGCPRPGDFNFVKFFNGVVGAGDNLRAVYRNDPVTTAPYHSMGFEHVGTEVLFVECEEYLQYPQFKDPYPYMDILEVGDHSQYSCIVPGKVQVQVVQ